jgi:hypothetical protein
MKNNNSTLEDPFSTDIIATINEVITYFSYLPYLFLYIIYILSIIREKKISYLSSINLQLIFVIQSDKNLILAQARLKSSLFY